MKQFKQDFISILRAVVCQDGTEIPENADWDKIWKLARYNHMETVVYVVAPDEKKAQFKNIYLNMVARTVRQGHLLEEIENALTAENIHYGLQKGSILKHNYPELTFRFMSDLDIYIRPEDRIAIRTGMESIGGVFRGKESGDE